MLATFPSTIDFPIYHQEKVVSGCRRLVQWYGEWGVPVLGTPQEFFYPREAFFDSIYHLRAAVAEERTEKIIRYLVSSGVTRAGR